MTEPNDIPAILARANAATTGPWKVAPMSAAGDDWLITIMEFRDITREALLLTTDRVHASEMNGASIEDDAEFCAHSRTDVPNMAAEILSLRAQLKQMKPDFASSFMRLHQSDDELLAKKRLDVLEELNEKNRLSIDACGWIEDHETQEQFRTFAEVADRELSRREKEE